MKELEVKRVPFMGTDLMAAKDESGTIWAGVRWMCDGMGLSKGQRDRQITNINADSVISKGAANLRLPTSGGKQSVLCLKLDFVPLWLAKINITPAMQAETPELARRYKGTTYEQVLNAHATKSLSGEYLLPLPEAGERLMSAGEVGAKLGISSNLVGKLTNKHGLKTDQYGKWMHDKSPHSSKEVPSFRYKECVVDKLREILKDDTNKED